MPEKDFFRDPPVRYLGYANEVGEAFRNVVPGSIVRASYTVAFAYVFADTVDKTWKIFKKDNNFTQAGKAGCDALIWQTLASVIIPGFTINRICYYSNRILAKHAKPIPFSLRSMLVIGIGLASIPVIIHPIDNAVTAAMNVTYRQWVK